MPENSVHEEEWGTGPLNHTYRQVSECVHRLNHFYFRQCNSLRPSYEWMCVSICCVCQLIILSGFQFFYIINKIRTLLHSLQLPGSYILSPNHFLLALFFFISLPLTMAKSTLISCLLLLYIILYSINAFFLFPSLPSFSSSHQYLVVFFSSFSYSHTCHSASYSSSHTITLPPPFIKPFTFGPYVIFQKVFFNGIFQMGKCTQLSNIPDVVEHH